MRVTSNSFSDGLIPQLNTLTEKQLTLQNQVATGQRITDPSDDPAAMGRILNIQSEKREISQYQRNISRLDSVQKFTFSAVENLQRLNQKATELSFRTSNAIGTESFDAFSLEVNEVLEQALELANSKYLDDHVFAGTATDSPPFVATRDGDGRITSVAYAGSADNANVNIADVSELEMYNDPTKNTEINSFLNNLVGLRDAMETYDDANVRTAADNLFTDEDNLLISLSDVSSKLLRLEVAENHQQDRFQQLEDRLSVEADADFSESIVNLTQVQNAYQAALSSGARALNQSLINFI